MNTCSYTRLHPSANYRTLAMLTCLAGTACAGADPGNPATSTFGPGPSIAETGEEDSDEGPSTVGGTTGHDDGAADDTSGFDTGPDPVDDGGTSSDPDPDATAGGATGGPAPECSPNSTCCASNGMFVSPGGASPGCMSECSSCDGQCSCETSPAGLTCGDGAGTCDGAGGCNVPTCNNGLETIEAGEECDGGNLNGQSCVTQGFDGGSLTCHANCTFDTGGCYQASIVPSRGLLSWTPAFTPDTDCTCSVANPDCHTLYRGRVNSIVGNTAQMQFQKMDGSNPSANVSYWVVVGELDPTCLDLHAYVERTSGTWLSTSNSLQTNVNIWPNQAAFDAAPCGDTKDLFVITGGAGGLENQRIWYQEQAVRFTKVCT